MKISIAIPTYDMHGEGVPLLVRSFDAILRQTFKDFEVVITDNSENDFIKNLCEDPKYRSLNIRYSKNPRKGMAQNTNEAIKQSRGELIKILYQDDFLATETSLQEIVEKFVGHWLVTACASDKKTWKTLFKGNKHVPKYSDGIKFGKNTIGSPSVLTIKNESPFLFDENMTWMLDCDYYKRLHDKYGEPVILSKINVIIGLGKHQTTNHLTDAYKRKERDYMVEKYGKTS